MLFAYKISDPRTTYLLRGNHESRNMTESFTFREEVLSHYDLEVYDLFMEVFDALPIAARVGDDYFCMHGGIGPEIRQIEMINKHDRFVETPLDGVLCDLVWADPQKDEKAHKNWTENKSRDCSYFFGREPARKLLDENNLRTIIRGHQSQNKGYKQHCWDGESEPPLVITIFSAPNYCGTYKNKAAVLIIDKQGCPLIKTYSEYKNTPYSLPDGMNLFDWSVPFVCEKLLEIWNFLITRCTERELLMLPDEKEIERIMQQETDDNAEKLKRKLALKQKVMQVGMMQMIMTKQRESAEKKMSMANVALDGKLDREQFMQEKPSISFS